MPSVRTNASWRAACVVLLVATLFALVTDLVSKSIAFSQIADTPVTISRAQVLEQNAQGEHHLGMLLPAHDPVVVLPGLLELKLVLNPGAVFGIGAGKRAFFVVFTFVALAFGLWAFRAWTTPRNRLAHIAIGLILGGGLGNLYDRVLFGCVRDFIHPLPSRMMPFGWKNPFAGSTEIWPYVSNLADLWLLIGIGLLMWHLLRHPSAGHTHKAA